MQKYIAVVSPKMDGDEISTLIAKDIAGALFHVSHQNYPAASELIRKVQALSKKHNKPISLIQDVSGMEDPLDLEFGLKHGADWVVSDKKEHLDLAKKFKKSAGVIFKGKDLPKGLQVDSIMAESFLVPDAEILGKPKQIKHLVMEHPIQSVLNSLLHIADQIKSDTIAVSDISLAKNLSWKRSGKKIIFAPKDQKDATKAAIYPDVHPIYVQRDLVSSLKNSPLVSKGDRVFDATNPKEAVIRLIM